MHPWADRLFACYCSNREGISRYYKRVPLENRDYEMEHSTMVYILDQDGQFVGPIGYTEPDDKVLPLLRDLVRP